MEEQPIKEIEPLLFARTVIEVARLLMELAATNKPMPGYTVMECGQAAYEYLFFGAHWLDGCPAKMSSTSESIVSSVIGIVKEVNVSSMN